MFGTFVFMDVLFLNAQLLMGTAVNCTLIRLYPLHNIHHYILPPPMIYWCFLKRRVWQHSLHCFHCGGSRHMNQGRLGPASAKSASIHPQRSISRDPRPTPRLPPACSRSTQTGFPCVWLVFASHCKWGMPFHV